MALTLREECEAGYGKLLEIAYRITGNSETARDLVGSGVLRALEHEEQYRPGDSFYGWMYFIMRNIFWDPQIRRKPRSCFSGAEKDTIYGQYYTDLLAGDSPAPHEQIDGIEAVIRLQRLTEDERKMLLRWCQGYTYQEISAELGIPTGTVKSRMFSIRQKLRE
jgi:RNA polymerase sigma-70 factor (ECF subfamily)